MIKSFIRSMWVSKIRPSSGQFLDLRWFLQPRGRLVLIFHLCRSIIFLCQTIAICSLDVCVCFRSDWHERDGTQAHRTFGLVLVFLHFSKFPAERLRDETARSQTSAPFGIVLIFFKLQGTTTWGKQQISIKEKSYFSNWTLLFRAGSIIPVTGTKEESQNVFQDEILIFQERKMYFGAEQWECVGQSLSLSKAADRRNFRSQFFCCPGWLRCVWWKQNLATVKCLDGHFLKRGAPWCTSFRRCSTSIFKATSDVSSEILADEGKELQQFLHRDHGLESGWDQMYHKHFSSRRKLVWFILSR